MAQTSSTVLDVNAKNRNDQEMAKRRQDRKDRKQKRKQDRKDRKKARKEAHEKRAAERRNNRANKSSA